MSEDVPLPTRSCIVTFMGHGRGLHYTLGAAAGEPLVAQPAGTMLDLYTVDQLRAYGDAREAAGVARERERCADICEQEFTDNGTAQKCAAAIRKGE